MKRRQTLKVLSALPLMAVFPSVALAAGDKKKVAKKAKGASNLLDPKDTLANAMKYTHDASTAGPMRANKNANCLNCAKYNVCMDGDQSCKPLPAGELKKADAAPCQIFKGKLVKAEGWCLSWQAKG